MRCDDAAEYVSAMTDGEAVPHDAARHIAGCGACQELLKSYAEMGTEIRSLGSLALAEPLRDRTWVQPQRSAATWWEKGWTMMRVPRIAFASLVLLLAVVGSRLAVVEVRAHEDGSVLLLKLASAGQTMTCSLSVADTRFQDCSGLAVVKDQALLYGVQILRKQGDHVVLGVVTSQGSRMESYSPDEVKRLATTQYSFAPGETLKVASADGNAWTLTGEWADHLPALPIGNQELDPAANELRVSAPLLLKDGKVVGDMEATAIADHAGEGVNLYLPGEGRFDFSLEPIAGWTAGTISMNRIKFKDQGHAYVVVTGTPVARGQTVWVLHDAQHKPTGYEVQGAVIGAGPVKASAQ